MTGVHPLLTGGAQAGIDPRRAMRCPGLWALRAGVLLAVVAVALASPAKADSIQHMRVLAGGEGGVVGSTGLHSRVLASACPFLDNESLVLQFAPPAADSEAIASTVDAATATACEYMVVAPDSPECGDLRRSIEEQVVAAVREVGDNDAIQVRVEQDYTYRVILHLTGVEAAASDSASAVFGLTDDVNGVVDAACARVGLPGDADACARLRQAAVNRFARGRFAHWHRCLHRAGIPVPTDNMAWPDHASQCVVLPPVPAAATRGQSLVVDATLAQSLHLPVPVMCYTVQVRAMQCVLPCLLRGWHSRCCHSCVPCLATVAGAAWRDCGRCGCARV